MIWRFIFTQILRWQYSGAFPNVSKSIIIMAPHTSYWDAILGKIYLKSMGVPHRFLINQKFFYFPLSILLRGIGGVPVGTRSQNAIHSSVHLLHAHDHMHIVICPEGAFAPRSRWHDGFYRIAHKAQVPIVVGYLDYRNKQAGTKIVLDSAADLAQIYTALRDAYKGVSGRYPERFLLPEYNVCKK